MGVRGISKPTLLCGAWLQAGVKPRQTLISNMKEWVKQRETKFAHYVDMLSAVQGCQKNFTGLSNDAGVKEEC